MILFMTQSGISFRRQSKVFSVAHQTLQSRAKSPDKKMYQKRITEDESNLIEKIQEIKAKYPAWGIRRVNAYLAKKTPFKIGIKRTERIMKQNNLLCSKFKKRIHRTTKKRLVATKINQLWATDMTSFMLTNAERLFLIIVMDIFTRRIVGWYLNRRCRAKEWLIALNNAVSVEFPNGTRGENLTLRMDNGCQPTSKLYIDTLNTCGINGEWIGFNCPEQNAHIESLIGTLKRDWLWLEECDSFNEALNLCKKAVSEYNSEHPHSSLGFWSPNEFTQLVRDGLVEIVDNCSINILTKVA